MLARSLPSTVRLTAGMRHLSQLPLNEEHPGLPATSPSSTPATDVQSTTLPNGLRIVSQDAHGAVSNVGVFVRAGSRFDAAPGTAHFLSHMAFKTTFHRSSLKIQRDVEDFGGSVGASSSRELLTYSGSALRDRAGDLVETLAECIMQPQLRPWEVKEEKSNFAFKLDELDSDAQTVVEEGLMSAGFGRASALGRSQYCNSSALGGLTDATLRDHMGAHFTAPNIVVAGTNIDHAELVGLLDMHMLEVPEGTASKPDAAEFVGGEVVTPIASNFTRLSVGFAAPGISDAGIYATGVLEALLGSTNASFGTFLESDTHKRIPTAVASADGVHAAAASVLPFADTSLVALTGVADNTSAGTLIDIFASCLSSLGSSIDAGELARAKAALKLGYATSLESSGATNDLGVQTLLRGKHTSLAETFAAIDAVSAADVQAVISNGVKAGVAISTVGDAASLPRYDRTLAKFQ